jgi:hypothetical protein
MTRSEHLAGMSTPSLRDEREADLQLTNSHHYKCSDRVIEYHADRADRISDELDRRNNA